MSVQDTANKLVQYCREGKWSEATEELYADNIVSLEPEGSDGPARLEGIEAKRQKDEMFASMMEEFHELKCSDPIIGDNFFSVSMWMDVTLKDAGRTQMDEICVYRVNQEGKIDQEQFFFTPYNPEV